MTFLPPNHQPLVSREAILEYYDTWFADPGFAADCDQFLVEIAESGELAWSRGRCSIQFSDASGNTAEANAKWVKVWSKQADGSWKAKLQIWNADPSD